MLARVSDNGYNTRMSNAPAPKPLVPKLDLLSITRRTKTCRTYVQLELEPHGERFTWITFGEGSLRTGDRKDGRWRLEARMVEGVVDTSHDPCLALRLPLIGLAFEWTDNHMHRFHAWIDPDSRGIRQPDFHVPTPGYDLRTHPKTCVCKDSACKGEKRHFVVPPGFYVPPFDPELYKLVGGKRVEIIMGTEDGE